MIDWDILTQQIIEASVTAVTGPAVVTETPLKDPPVSNVTVPEME